MAIPLGNRDLRETAGDGIRHIPGDGRSPGWAVGPAWWPPWTGKAGLGSVELETSPAVAILGLGLVAPGD